MRKLDKFLIWFFCKIGDHDWTSAKEQGISPTSVQLSSSKGFRDYAKMYCKHCGTISELSYL